MLTRRDFLRRLFPAIVGTAVAPALVVEAVQRLSNTTYSFGPIRRIISIDTAPSFFERDASRLYGSIAKELSTETPYLKVLDPGFFPITENGIMYDLSPNPLRLEWIDGSILDNGPIKNPDGSRIGRLWTPAREGKEVVFYGFDNHLKSS